MQAKQYQTQISSFPTFPYMNEGQHPQQFYPQNMMQLPMHLLLPMFTQTQTPLPCICPNAPHLHQFNPFFCRQNIALKQEEIPTLKHVKVENSQDSTKAQNNDQVNEQKFIGIPAQNIVIEQLPEPKDQGNSKTFLKNMPKNFSKAIISMIQSMTKNHLINYFDTKEEVIEFLDFLQSYKKKMKNLKHLRELWLNTCDNEFQKKVNRAFRKLSNQFFKRKSVQYIFSSKISDTQHHLTHRNLFIHAIQNPKDFRLISKL